MLYEMNDKFKQKVRKLARTNNNGNKNKAIVASSAVKIKKKTFLTKYSRRTTINNMEKTKKKNIQLTN